MNIRRPNVLVPLACLFLIGFMTHVAEGAAGKNVMRSYGPFTIPQMMGPAMGMATFSQYIDPPCNAGTFITKIQAQLVYSDGSTANYNTNAMLHHVMFYNANVPDLVCPDTEVERVFASGNERTRLELPTGFGYEIKAGTQWWMAGDLMNLGNVDQQVYLEIEAFCSDSFPDRPLTPVRPLWLDEGGCSDTSDFNVPAGFSETTADWKSTVSGVIVSVGGHVHDYGISVSTEDLDSHEIIVTNRAAYAKESPFFPPPVVSGGFGHPGRARALSWYTLPKADPAYEGHIQHIEFKNAWFYLEMGHTLRLYARYDVPQEVAPNGIPNVMGIQLAYIALTENGSKQRRKNDRKH